jgi:predicted O-methyltransferase YrrM
MPNEGPSRDFDEVAKLLTLLARLQLGNQTQTILELGRLGFSSARIAELVGTTPATARATVNQNKGRQRAQRGERT